MNYLFDTDAISNLVSKRPSKELTLKIRELPPACQFISSVTVMEIVYGAFKSDHPTRHIDNLEKILLPNVNVLDFDAKAAYVCGRIQAELNLAGMPLYLADLQIASMAMANQMTLITGNTKHFQRIKELKYDNWM